MTAADVKVRFSGRGAGFHATVKERVDVYFDERGLSRAADLHMYLKTALWVGASALLYAVILSARLAPGWALVAAMGLGFTLACVGFNVGHDAIHGAFSESARMNKLFSWSFQGIGASSFTWSIAHNVVHHTYTNMPGHDGDVEPGPLMRFHTDHAAHPAHRFQHLYAWVLYCFTTLVWVFVKDLAQLRRWSIEARASGKPMPRGAAFSVISSKIFHGALFFVVPLAVMPYPLVQMGLGYVCMHFVAGLTLAVVFQLAHLVEGPTMPRAPSGGSMEDSWAEHQMRTTANFARGNTLVQFVCGGLNYQVEHHLFPRVCHVHYPAISSIVEATAREHGLPYHEHPTFFGAVRSHGRTLRHLGTAPLFNDGAA